MGMILTGNDTGTPLQEILDNLGIKECDIEFRCEWEHGGEHYDELFGLAKYKDGSLIPYDHDSYYLDDKYDRYEYDEQYGLTVWNKGEYKE